MLRRRIFTTVLLALALAAPPAAFAMPGSTGSGSDESSAATAGPRTDLRSPDTRDAASGVVQSNARQDLRSPDARDAGAQTGSLAGTVSPAETVTPVQTVTVDDGFEWGSAGIGAAAMLAIVLAAAALVALLVPRRRMRSPIPH